MRTISVRSARRRVKTARSEKGSVMIVALVFLLLAGVATSAILAQTEVNLKTTSLVRVDQQRTYAADAGIEFGIQQLRTNSDFCPNEGMTKTLTLPTAVNGSSVQVTCNNKQGFLDGRTLNGYAVVTTSTGSNSLKASQGGTSTLTGDLFITGGTSISGGSDVSALANKGYSPDHCATPPATAPPGIHVAEWHCEAHQSPKDAYSLPLTKPGTPAPFATVGTCRVFYPGTYDATTPIQLDPTHVNYLVSGVYYLVNQSISLGNDGVLIGGAPSAASAPAIGDTPESDVAKNHADQIAPCLSAPGAAQSADPTRDRGVELIMGGTSQITVGNHNTIELYTRSPKSGDTGSAGVSLFGVPNPSPRSDFAKAEASPILSVDSSSNTAELFIHGAVYAPSSPVALTARNHGVARIEAGLVSSTLELASSGSINDGFSVHGPPSKWAFTDRFVVLTAQSTTSSGSIEKAQAVVVMRNDGAQTPSISSWRAVGVP